MFDKAKDLYKLQKKAREIKAKLKNTHIEAEQDGVVITINGEQEVMNVTISEEAMQDKSKLEKSIKEAFMKGIKKSQQIGAELMKEVMGPGFNLPGM